MNIRTAILSEELARQNNSQQCPSCRQIPGHMGWLVCVERRVEVALRRFKETAVDGSTSGVSPGA